MPSTLNPGTFNPGTSESATSLQTGPGDSAEWHLRHEGTRATFQLQGDWIGRLGPAPGDVGELLACPVRGLTSICFDTSRLGRWDSLLIAFLWQVRSIAGEKGLTFNEGGLPEASRHLLSLLDDTPAATAPIRKRPRWLALIGNAATGTLTEIGALSILLGQVSLRAGAAVMGRAKMRGVDLLDNLYDAGPAALPIVTVVNFLVGAILAFVGVVQLRRLAAESFVANLVGLALAREIAGVMTAIVMAGRTGGAYAARIATMQGNEEIDALQASGIPVEDYIVLPSVIALTATMPLLYLYGCAIGILGGFTVAIAMMNVTPLAYLQQTRMAVPLGQFAFGFVKSLCFGTLIALTSCRIGMQAGRSAAAVGRAATSAVVVGIVGVIALDAIFAVGANALGH